MFGLFKNSKEIEVKAPIDGKVIALEEVPDEVFSKKMVGDGCAIIPLEDNKVSAPIDGEIVQIFKTNHAIGIRGHNDLEILIHIGIDTVDLKGEGFIRKIEPGSQVHTGDVMVEADLDFLKKHNKQTITPIVITNSSEFVVSKIKTGEVVKGDTVLKIKKIER